MSRLVVLLSAAVATRAHLCLLQPEQRGGFNVTDAGDRTCFQPTGPCGRVAAADPVVTLTGGEGYHIFLQQNLNHYNVGHPGYIDVAIAEYPAPSDDNFTTVLAVVPDYWAHLQAKQTNFSVSVLIPNAACDHCVIRVRYNPNKPTEPVFHNCADVRIKAGPPAASGRRILGLLTPGAPSSAASFSSVLAEVLPSGQIQPLLDLASNEVDIVDGMSTSLGAVYYALGIRRGPIADQGPPPGPAPGVLVSYDVSSGRSALVNISLPTGDTNVPTQWTALVPIPAYANVPGKSALALLGLAPSTGSPGSWVFQARLLDPATGVATGVLALSAPQDTFVNVFGATAAMAQPTGSTGSFFFLTGDENSLWTLGAQIGRVDFDTQAASPSAVALVTQDTTAFTLSNLHLDLADGGLYSVSPGLFSNTTWALVKVDPATGAVAKVGAGIAPTMTGLFASYYGGAVGGASITLDGAVLHMFRHGLDERSLSLASVALDGSLQTAPTLLTGVNGAIAVTCLTAVTA